MLSNIFSESTIASSYQYMGCSLAISFRFRSSLKAHLVLRFGGPGGSLELFRGGFSSAASRTRLPKRSVEPLPTNCFTLSGD